MSKRSSRLSRFSALFLALSLALPAGPVFALRSEQAANNTGLEEKIAQMLGRPAAGAEELEGLIDWVTDGIHNRREKAGDQIDRQAIRSWVSGMVEWLSRLLGADVVEKVWLNPAVPAIHDRLITAIEDLGQESMDTRFMSRIEQAFMGIEQEGPLSRKFFQGIFQVDPVMFSRILSRVHYSYDEPWKWEEAILDVIGEIPDPVKTILKEAFRILQKPLLERIKPPDPLDRARTLAAVLPQRVSELARALQADDSPAARFWGQRINPLVWRDASRVQELLVWMTEHEFPVRQDMLDDLLVAFRERTPAQPFGQGTYMTFSLPEVIAALQVFLEKPELKQSIGRLLMFRYEKDRARPSLVGRLGGLGSLDRIKGENPYGNVLSLASLPADFPDRSYGSFENYRNAVVAEMRSFYQKRSSEVIPPKAGSEEEKPGVYRSGRELLSKLDFELKETVDNALSEWIREETEPVTAVRVFLYNEATAVSRRAGFTISLQPLQKARPEDWFIDIDRGLDVIGAQSGFWSIRQEVSTYKGNPAISFYLTPATDPASGRAAGAEEVVPVINLSDYSEPFSANEVDIFKAKKPDSSGVTWWLKRFKVQWVRNEHVLEYARLVRSLQDRLGSDTSFEIAEARVVKDPGDQLYLQAPYIPGRSLDEVLKRLDSLRTAGSPADKEYERLWGSDGAFRKALDFIDKETGGLADVHGSSGRPNFRSTLENFQVPQQYLDLEGNLRPELYGKMKPVIIDPLSMPRLQERMAKETIEALLPRQLTSAQGFLLGLLRKYELFPRLEQTLLEQHDNVLPGDAQAIFRQLGNILATDRVGVLNQNILEFEIRGDLLVAREMDSYGENALAEMPVPLPASLKQNINGLGPKELLDVFLEAGGAEEVTLLTKDYGKSYYNLMFSPDGESIYAGNVFDKRPHFRRWSVSKKRELASIPFRDTRIRRGPRRSMDVPIAFSSDLRRFAVFDGNGRVQVKDLSADPLIAPFFVSSRITPVFAAFGPKETLLTMAPDGPNYTVEYWSVKQGRIAKFDVDNEKEMGISAALSPNGELAAFGDASGRVRFADLAKGRMRKKPLSYEHSDRVSALVFSADGRFLATATGSLDLTVEPVIRVIDLRTEQPVPGLELRLKDRVYLDRLAFSPDGKRLALGGSDGSIRLWAFPSAAGAEEGRVSYMAGVRVEQFLGQDVNFQKFLEFRDREFLQVATPYLDERERGDNTESMRKKLTRYLKAKKDPKGVIAPEELRGSGTLMTLLLVMDSGNNIVGYAVGEVDTQGGLLFAEISEFAVKSGFQKLGIGSLLFEKVLNGVIRFEQVRSVLVRDYSTQSTDKPGPTATIALRFGFKKVSLFGYRLDLPGTRAEEQVAAARAAGASDRLLSYAHMDAKKFQQMLERLLDRPLKTEQQTQVEGFIRAMSQVRERVPVAEDMNLMLAGKKEHPDCCVRTTTLALELLKQAGIPREYLHKSSFLLDETPDSLYPFNPDVKNLWWDFGEGNVPIHLYLVIQFLGIPFILELSGDQFLKEPGGMGRFVDTGIILIPVAELKDQDWPYVGGNTIVPLELLSALRGLLGEDETLLRRLVGSQAPPAVVEGMGTLKASDLAGAITAKVFSLLPEILGAGQTPGEGPERLEVILQNNSPELDWAPLETVYFGSIAGLRQSTPELWQPRVQEKLDKEQGVGVVSGDWSVEATRYESTSKPGTYWIWFQLKPAAGAEETPLEVKWEPTGFAEHLRPERIEQALKVAGAVERGGYDSLSGGRGFVIRLPEEERFIVQEGSLRIPVSALLLVGIGSSDETGKITRPQPAVPYTAYHRATLKITFEDGRLATKLLNPLALGVLPVSLARRETELATYLLNRGIPTRVPFGPGQYPVLLGEDGPAGFKFLGIPDLNDVRVGDQTLTSEQVEEVGRTLRAVHDGGFENPKPEEGVILESPHMGNFALVRVDGKEKVFVYDLAGSKKKSELPGVDAVLADQYFDLLQARNSVIQDFGAEMEAPFLKGYFYDRWGSFDPAQLDWGLIRWTGWAFFGEATRAPFGSIDSPIVRLFRDLNHFAESVPVSVPVVSTPSPAWSEVPLALRQLPKRFNGEIVVPVVDRNPEGPGSAIPAEVLTAKTNTGISARIEPVPLEDPSQPFLYWIADILRSYARAGYNGDLGIVAGVLPDQVGESLAMAIPLIQKELEEAHPSYSVGWNRMRNRVHLIWASAEKTQERIETPILSRWVTAAMTDTAAIVPAVGIRMQGLTATGSHGEAVDALGFLPEEVVRLGLDAGRERLVVPASDFATTKQVYLSGIRRNQLNETVRETLGDRIVELPDDPGQASEFLAAEIRAERTGLVLADVNVPENTAQAWASLGIGVVLMPKEAAPRLTLSQLGSLEAAVRGGKVLPINDVVQRDWREPLNVFDLAA